MRFVHFPLIAGGLLLGGLVGCSPGIQSQRDDGGAGVDAGDAGTDGGADAGPDAGPDAGADAGTDGGVDGGGDGGVACAAPSDDWLVYRHDLGGSGRSADRLPTSAAAALTQTWAFTDGTHGGYNYANPIVDGRVLYLSSGIGYLFALDTSTGDQLWNAPAYAPTFVQCDGTVTGPKGPIGAPAVVGSRVFMPSGSGSVDAYDKVTGVKLWSTTIADPMQNEFIFSSAFPAKGNLYIGVASIFDCNQVVSGRVVGIDELTGAVVGTWWGAAFPDPTNHGAGATVWSSPSYDPQLDRIFITTGTIANGDTKAQQPLAQAIVAFDPNPTTGADGQPEFKTLDYYSPITTLFAEDLEFGASPLLFDAGGRHLIGAASKGGIFWVLDRTNLAGGIVWQQTISGFGFNPDQGDGSIVSATVSADGATVFVGGGITADGSYQGGVYAFDAATGAPKWTFHTAGFVLAALASAGDVVFATATDKTTYKGTIYALNAADGSVLFHQGGFKPLFGEVTYARGKLFVPEIGTVANGGGRLLAFTPGPVCPP